MSSIPSDSRNEVFVGCEIEIDEEGIEGEGERERGREEDKQEQRMSNRFSMNSVSSPPDGSRLR